MKYNLDYFRLLTHPMMGRGRSSAIYDLMVVIMTWLTARSDRDHRPQGAAEGLIAAPSPALLPALPAACLACEAGEAAGEGEAGAAIR